MSKLILECKHFLDMDWNCQVSHIYREANRCADTPANLAKQCPWGLRVVDTPPPTVVLGLLYDNWGIAMPMPRTCVT